jgi:sialic acid synthase SpsE
MQTKNKKTSLIAEIGWNHMGDMDLAKTMIAEASKSGAD